VDALYDAEGVGEWTHQHTFIFFGRHRLHIGSVLPTPLKINSGANINFFRFWDFWFRHFYTLRKTAYVD
jgi:hypothetical protein